jgi:hypothetical protein
MVGSSSPRPSRRERPPISVLTGLPLPAGRTFRESGLPGSDDRGATARLAAWHERGLLPLDFMQAGVHDLRSQ